MISRSFQIRRVIYGFYPRPNVDTETWTQGRLLVAGHGDKNENKYRAFPGETYPLNLSALKSVTGHHGDRPIKS